MTTYVAYCRVSTDRQGRSGLGLEAQQSAIQAFLKPDDILIEPPFIEVESGKRSDRPELQRAIQLCQQTGATLLIAKLDRLARNVAFIANLMESGVPFIAADMPSANKLTVHILAAVAEDERDRISQRTKAALAAAKARGVGLGGDRGCRHLTDAHRAEATAALKAQADRAALRAVPMIDKLQRDGITSLRGIARALNARGMTTARGGTWTATAVRRTLARVA